MASPASVTRLKKNILIIDDPNSNFKFSKIPEALMNKTFQV